MRLVLKAKFLFVPFKLLKVQLESTPHSTPSPTTHPPYATWPGDSGENNIDRVVTLRFTGQYLRMWISDGCSLIDGLFTSNGTVKLYPCHSIGISGGFARLVICMGLDRHGAIVDGRVLMIHLIYLLSVSASKVVIKSGNDASARTRFTLPVTRS
jgi:hypothetical protein